MGNPSIALDQALAAHRAGDLSSAEAIYLTILGNRNAAYNLAISCGAQGRHSDAQALLRLPAFGAV